MIDARSTEKVCEAGNARRNPSALACASASNAARGLAQDMFPAIRNGSAPCGPKINHGTGIDAARLAPSVHVGLSAGSSFGRKSRLVATYAQVGDAAR